METQLVNRYAVNMHGVLSCYDRILIMGTLPGACYADGMSAPHWGRVLLSLRCIIARPRVSRAGPASGCLAWQRRPVVGGHANEVRLVAGGGKIT